MRNLNLDYIETFVSVIELGSFSAAAERLGLTQPAVSQQVRQLEKKLETRLVERVGRTARPTAAGAELLAHAGRIGAVVSSAMEAVSRHADGTTGRLCIGSGATACIFLLPPVLGSLRRRFPNLDITVTTGNTAEIVKAVEENQIDIALVTLPASGRMLEITPVVKDDFVLVAPPEMELPRRVTATNLSRLPVLLFEPGGNTRRIIDQWIARGQTTLSPVMSLGSVEGIKAMVMAGMGCAVLPGMAVPKDAGAEMAVRPLSPPLYRELAVVIRRDKRLSKGLKAARDALLAFGGDAAA